MKPFIIQLNKVISIKHTKRDNSIFVFKYFTSWPSFLKINIFTIQKEVSVNTLTRILNIAPTHPPIPDHKKLNNPLIIADDIHHSFLHIKTIGIKKTNEISKLRNDPRKGSGK